MKLIILAALLAMAAAYPPVPLVPKYYPAPLHYPAPLVKAPLPLAHYYPGYYPYFRAPYPFLH